MDFLQNLLTIVWALRFVLVFVAALVLLALWLDARGARDAARAEARQLYFDNAELRARLSAHRRRTAPKRPIISGRVIS